MQTRTQSLIESFINVVVGYVVAILSQMAIFPILDIHVELEQNLIIGAFFTVVSIIRSYTLRRAFNAYTAIQNNHRRKVQ